MLYLDLFLITLMTVIVLDVSGFYEEMYTMFKKWLTNGKFTQVDYIKPWSCSFCMSHHINLIYIIVIGQFSLLNWAFILGLSVMTPVIKEIIIFIRSFLIKILCEMEEYFQL